ncbi:MAG: alpha/beta fold hydrolase [Acidobacteria bacterium]|nr:alpha/beta fold hydrolase [Acidobacteriota bacterium]
MLAREDFRVSVAQADIDDLHERLDRTRWLDQVPGTSWEYGMNTAWLRDLCEHWRTDFDWRAAEARLNAWPQFTSTIDEIDLHYYDVRSPVPGALPLVLLHGWPGSVAEYVDIIGPLTDPAAYGGDPQDAFHVVVPSLPGFGFSGPTDRPGVDSLVMANVVTRLMAGLGHDHYVAQGGDVGAGVASVIARIDPEHAKAVHLNLLPVGPPDPSNPTAGLNEDDAARVSRTFAFLADDAGYWRIQETHPQTVAQGLNDSPAGLCGWITEKFRSWTDCDGDVDAAFTRDELLTNVSIYWFTRTIGSSARFYFETRASGGSRSAGPPGKAPVPVGFADFPGEHFKMARAWAEEAFDLVHWSTQPAGGHFPALQVPDLFVDEVRGFFRRFRGA